MENQGTQNAYLDQVMVEQKQLENDLRGRRKMMNMPQAAQAQQADAPVQAMRPAGGAVAYPEPPAGPAVEVRVTGWWRYKNVIVPPNAYVVHTRRGEPEPVHCGLGISFKFDPVIDSFLVVPAAMQTIIINARSICKERQGVLIQAYVQWIIEDFKTAYRKLDFTDPVDPMRVVNVQLREQAEAAIKDKVATLGVDEVLSDKQPIIRELTARLRHVAEGDGGGEGLGLRIVTVQIKEAIVSSSRLWETLQRPFRAERAKDARLAELASESIVRKREAEEAEARATAEIETQANVARRRAEAEAQTFDRAQAERVRRAKIEAESLTATMASEKEQIERLAVLSRARLEHELAEVRLRRESEYAAAEQAIALDAARRKVENDLSPIALDLKIIETLPSIAEKLPHPTEHRSIAIGSDGMASLISGVKQVVEAVRAKG
jgi:hypothetical protein